MDRDDTIVRVDPATNRATDRIDVGTEPRNGAFVGDALWIGTFQDDQVLRLDVS